MFIASADAHLATCSLSRAGAPRTVCRRFRSDFQVARSSEPLAASSMTACTTRANSSCRHRTRVPSANVHAALFAGLLELHRLVGAVDQRRAAAVRGWLAHLADARLLCHGLRRIWLPESPSRHRLSPPLHRRAPSGHRGSAGRGVRQVWRRPLGPCRQPGDVMVHGAIIRRKSRCGSSFQRR